MIILTGASASGKTEITKVLVKKYNFKKLVTYTSRNMRIGEVNDVDYHFISKDSFEEKINNDFFFEYVYYNGNYYGTAREDITDDKVVILEPNGFKKYVEAKLPNVYSFFLFSNEEKRENRMIYRGDNEEDIKKRIEGDKINFSLDKVYGVDYIMNSNDLTIDELAKEIFELYNTRLNK